MNRISTIYKIHLVNHGNEISQGSIVVFYGEDKVSIDELNTRFETSPTDKAFIDRGSGEPIFSSDELQDIKVKNTKVRFSKQSIYPDDTILSIKLKILKELETEISIEELFLFCSKREVVAPRDIYNTLTQKRRVVLSKPRLENMLQNFKVFGATGEPVVSLQEDKPYYSYEDIAKMEIFNKEVNVTRMVGQKIFLIDTHYPFPYNPFDMKHYDNLLYSASKNATSTTNNNLLLDNGQIQHNVLYLATAKDVLSRNKSNGEPLNEQYLLNVYFPSLVSKGIGSELQLDEDRDRIMKDTKQLQSDTTTNTFLKEDMLHQVSENVISKNIDGFQYETKGILEFRFAIQQTFSFNAPLDTIFKIIHTSENVPFTKLNPGVHREPMYRLYGEEKTRDNRVIPTISKTKASQLATHIGKAKCVAAYIVVENEKDIEFVCELQENGDIILDIRSQTPISLTKINDLILQYANPFIKQIADFLSESGYKFQLYSGLEEDNIDVLHIKYGCDVIITSDTDNFDLKSVQKCLSPIFIINSFNISARDGINMRYRKVSNFNKMTSKEAFVIEQIKRREGYQGELLVENLMNAHDISEDESREIIARVASQLTIDTGGIGSKTMRIRSNPGFPVSVKDLTKKSLKTKRKIRMEISGIDNLQYINSIDPYMNAFIALCVSYKKAIDILPDIERVCNLIQNDMVRAADILSASDKNIIHKQDITIDAENDEVHIIDDVQPISFSEDLNTINKGTALDLIYGSDEEEDYGDYEDDDYESDMEGGSARKNKQQQKYKKIGGDGASNIVGMRLSKPNPFVKIMEEADKDLFLAKSDKTGKYFGYSKTCDSAYGRQPVLMTQDEYQTTIEKEKSGIIDRYGREEFDALDEKQQEAVIKKETQLDDRYIVTYGSSKSKKNVYACPRYWCLKTNSYIHPSEMTQKKDEDGNPVVNKDGKPIMEHPTCGGVIPRGQNKVQDDGNFVYEFTGSNRISSKTGKYIENYPAFMPRDKHPNNKCIPCCFKFTEVNGELKRSGSKLEMINDCKKDIEDTPDNENEKQIDKNVPSVQPSKGDALYILDQRTVPVHLGRWGFLPIEIQYLLKEYSSDYLEDLPRMQIKEDMLVLLRHGVETKTGENPQHFLSAMADIMFYNDPSDKMSVSDFKQYLVNKITLERFARYQNGNLVQEFYSSVDIEKQDIEPYKSSPLYQKNNETSFRKLVRAYDNYKAFFIIDSTNIDYTYTWDLMCDKDIHQSHPNGANLVIIDVPNDDDTMKVEILCPTNHYSNTIFNRDKPTMIVVKKGDIYEPLYSLKKTKESITFQKYFSHEESDTPTISKDMTPPVISTFIDKVVNPIYQNKCTPMASLRREYKFKSPILLSSLMNLLKKSRGVDIKILRHVFNYSYKTVALEVKIGTSEGIIPCYPSGNKLSTDTAVTFIDDESLYKTYSETIQFINKITHHFKNHIPIQPAFKLVDNEVIVGIITMTNQVILLSTPTEISNINDDIPVMRHKGFSKDHDNLAKTFIDIETTNNNSIDKDRSEYVNKIRLETNFFNAFRNTIRILLHDYSYLEIREHIEKIIENKMMLYGKKLEEMVTLIKQLIEQHVVFKEYIDTSIIKNASLCIVADANTCSERNPVCLFEQTPDSADTTKCVLVVPKSNLISPEIDNETVYIYKIADQLLRYVRIRSYLLDTSQFLSVENSAYQMETTEVILSQSSLKNEYYNDLIPYKDTGYDKINTFDNVNPSHMTTTYNTNYDYNKIIEMDVLKPFSGNVDNPEQLETSKKSNSPKKLKINMKITE